MVVRGMLVKLFQEGERMKYEIKVEVVMWDVEAANVDEAGYIASSTLYTPQWWDEVKHKINVKQVKSMPLGTSLTKEEKR
jgi:hypothetical protein